MGPYSLIMSDPPWKFEVWDEETGLGKSPDKHYDTMTPSEMMAIPVKEWVAQNAMLGLWVYDPMLDRAFEIAEAWGFRKYTTVLFRWFKTTETQMRLFEPTPRPNYGTGYHTRGGACEEMLLFKRGKGLKVRDHSIRKEFWSPVREHSRKPDEVPDWMVRLYGDVPRLDMFARTQRPGWDAWGNEVDKFK